MRCWWHAWSQIQSHMGLILRPPCSKCYSLSHKFIFSTQQFNKMTFHCSYHRFPTLAALSLHLEMSSVSLYEPISLQFRVLISLRHLFLVGSPVNFLVCRVFLFFPIKMEASYMSWLTPEVTRQSTSYKIYYENSS